MSGRVVLHVGTMKSGTSFLQSVLERQPDELAGVGVEFLGGRFGRQTKAVLDVLKLPKEPRRHTERWRRLVAEADPERVSIVSMEFLSFAGPRQVEAFLEPLRDRDVDVVVTLRDQLRAVPAQWQSYVRNLGTSSWADYAREIRSTPRGADRTRAHRTFHRAQDAQVVMERWADRPEVRHVSLVTVPGPGAPREELWHRFCDAVDIPRIRLPEAGAKLNESIGYASCDVLRRLNHRLGDVPAQRYRKVVRPLARESLATLRDREDRPTLDRDGAEFARERNARLRILLDGAGHRVFGGADDLPVPERLDDLPSGVEPPRPEDVKRAAQTAWEHLAARAGVASGRPADLDALLDDGARMLREATTRPVGSPAMRGNGSRHGDSDDPL